MTVRTLRWIPVLGLILAPFAVNRAADEPPAARDKDAAGGLPKGAVIRLGVDRLGVRIAAVLPPEYKTYVGTDSRGVVRRYDLATGDPLGDAAAGFHFGPMVVSGDGTRVVSTSTGRVKIQDVATGKPVREIGTAVSTPSEIMIGGHPSVAVSADGKVVAQAASGFNRTAKDKLAGLDVSVWDVEKNAELAKVTAAQTRHVAPLLSADGTILVTWGMDVFVPPSTPVAPGGVPATPPTPAPAAATADGNRLVQVWDVAAKKEITRFRFAGHLPTAVAISPDGKVVAVSCGDGLIETWDARTGKELVPILGRVGQGRQIAFSPDGKALAAVGADGSIQQWAVADGSPRGTTEFPVPFPSLTPAGVGFAAGRVVAWGTLGTAPVVWEAPSGKLLTPLGEHVMGIKSVAFPPGGKHVVTSGSDSRIVRWDAATGKTVQAVGVRPPRFPGAPYQFVRPVLDLSPDAARGISSGVSPGVYDTEQGMELFALPPDRTGRGMVGQSLSEDRSRIAILWTPNASQGKRANCAVWDLTARRKLADLELPGPLGYGCTAAFSPDGSRLVTAVPGTDPTGRRVTVFTGWDLKTGNKLGEFDDPTWTGGMVHLTAANNTSAVLVTPGGELWGLDYAGGQKGELIDKFLGGNQAPVVFSPDGKRFAVGALDPKSGTFGARVYDWPRGTPLHTFAGHSQAITALAFSPDGKTLATGSQDTTVLLWDTAAIGK